MPQADPSRMPELPENSATSDPRVRGYAIFRNILGPAQVDELRRLVTAYLRRSGRARYGRRYELRGLNRSSELARILCGEALMAVVKACVGPDAPVLTGECDIMADTTSGWHKDVTPGLTLDPSIYEDESFRVCKLAIYLQDQPASSPAALKVRPGSHRCADGSSIPGKALDVRRGDVVAFDVRLDHAGQHPTVTERLAHRLLASLGAATRIDAEPAYSMIRRGARLATGRGRQRLGLFMTFGPESPAVRSYEASGRRTHGPIPAALDPAAAALLRQGVGIIQAA